MNWLHAIYVVDEIHSMRIVVDCVERRRTLHAHLKVNQWPARVSLSFCGSHCLFYARAAGSISCPLALPVNLVCTVKRNNNNIMRESHRMKEKNRQTRQ